VNKDFFEKSLVERVKTFLLKYPKTRDDDEYLIKLIWYFSCSEPEKMTAMELLKMDLPKTESIVRARRKLQQENPELRGEKYEDRKNYTKKVKSELREDSDKWEQ